MFYKDIYNLLTVGELPNLFSQKEDYLKIKDRARKQQIIQRCQNL
ncbi:unnamed protein product [Paramecium sonneborni]|uniref:Uncharacterized protein n=1 Tax=Paramecium sonneborni TaxID=65129 RepID=A0A8S1RMU8_9CILI|nr:unnamed protein product [Paramecium sonneborni]